MSDLLDRHDFLLADLDGTLYRGAGAVPGAVEVAAVAEGDADVEASDDVADPERSSGVAEPTSDDRSDGPR